MTLMLLSLSFFLLGGLGALASFSRPGFSAKVGATGALLGSLVGGLASILEVTRGEGASLHFSWSVPYGSLFLSLDALSAFFLIPTFLLGGLGALYGVGYLRGKEGNTSLALHWLFYNILIGCMALVFLARNAVLFLFVWELMTISSFFLVTFEDDKPSVRAAGWTYLVAAHVGVAFLLGLFLLLGADATVLDFDQLSRPDSSIAGWCFLLALGGFGLKAGFMPLHVWLPEAHPAAPSHVSAVMSGVMIKTGIYGLIRIWLLLGPPQGWWGTLLITIGLTSGIVGVLFALAQHDLKRLLAYHSVENIGIIALGLGVGLLGQTQGMPLMAVLGYAGALLHVLNHALFKGLLFLGAGAIAHATGSRDLDSLGGLLKRMPHTGISFLIGAAAISGLPPLNGFVSELLIYLGAFKGVMSLAVPGVGWLVSSVAGLALIGALAVACFTKAFGIVFLGEPRGHEGAHAHDPVGSMRLPMVVLTFLCVGVGLSAPWVLPALYPVIAVIAPEEVASSTRGLEEASSTMAGLQGVALIFLLGLGVLILLRHFLLSGRTVKEGVTWDCGYVLPTSRMQYSASSFAQPLTRVFAMLLRSRVTGQPVRGLFSASSHFATETPDVSREALYAPLFTWVGRGLARLRWLQHGRVHLYVLYIALTLLVLLIWKVG